MRLSRSSFIFLLFVASCAAKDCYNKKTSNSKLFCYYGKAQDITSCKCSHVILPANSDVKSIESLKSKLSGSKLLLSVNEFSEGLINTLKSTKVDGLEINLKKLDSKNDISEFISTVRSKLGSDLYLALTVPSKTETLAKYYDFKALSKNADVFILQTAFLGASKNVTFHPSRLSGLWDIQNTDSVVDLISGLGAPLSKLVITAPVQGFQFTLQNDEHTAPGSPAVELSTITRDEICEKMNANNWTLERDQDQAGPYIFREKEWIAFEDATSMDIKAKYSRVRGLAGLALKDVSQDGGKTCGETLLEAAFNGLSKQARAPRGAVLRSLEREILETPKRHLDNVQVSPYRISRVIDVEGKVHAVRQDTRTEFECSRQGYFVHPRSCGRFYRCVKFDQLSDEYSVFEFDCPAGLAFDERVEVCVWPGSLPHAEACSGSSEIAPVPRERFICPTEPGYYADPENCRWFFACLDHGKSPLSAYEFRCPYGLVYDEERLLCEWSWLVPKCGSGKAAGGVTFYGGGAQINNEYSGSGYEGRSGDDFALDQYNGLGSLQKIHLGGLTGPLEQPVAKVYSSFNHGQDGYHVQSNSNGDGSYSQINHGNSLNIKQVASGNGFNANDASNLNRNYASINQGVSSNANDASAESGNYDASSLNIHTSNQANYNGDGSYSHGEGRGTQHAHTLNYQGNSGEYHGANVEDNGQYHGFNGEDNGKYHGDDNGQYHGVNGEDNGQYQGVNSQATSYQSGYANSASNTGAYNYESGAAYDVSQNNGAYNHQAQFSYQSGAGVNGEDNGQYHGVNGEDNGQYHGVNGEDNGQYQGVNSQATSYQSGYANSASNTEAYNYESGAAYDVSQNNGAYNHQAQSGYQSGASVSSEGGLYSHGSYGNGIQYAQNEDNSVKNLESGSYVSSSFNQNLNGNNFGNLRGYSGGFGKKDVQILQHGVNIVSPVTVSSIATVTAAPAISSTGFQSYHGGIVANIPDLQYKLESPSNINAYLSSSNNYKNLITSYADSNQNNFGLSTPAPLAVTSGYAYPKPSISFVEGVSSTARPISVSTGGYDYPKPSVHFVEGPSSTPASISYQTNVGYDYPKPSVQFVEGKKTAQSFSSFRQKVEHKQEKVYLPPVQKSYGYSYPKPSISFEEKLPTTSYVQHFESVLKPIKPEVLTTYTYQKPTVHVSQQEGYHYEKPAIKFEEKPAVQTVHYQQPAVVEHKVLQPAVTYQEIHKQEGYHYDKPSIKFEEKPVVQTVHYQQPAIVEHKVLQPAATYQEIHKQEGYHYEKPAIKFEEKPAVQTVHYQQPAVAYQEIHKQEGYHYEKPAIKFEEKPVVQTVHYQQPAVTYQEIHKQEGYHYEKPAIKFEEKPVIQTVHYQQPAVVEHKVLQPAVTYQEIHKQEGYHYEKPAIKFEEKPVVQTVHYQQPAVTYQEIHKQEGYHYEKPAIKFEEKPVIQTVHYQQPAVVEHKVLQPAVTYQEIHKQEGYHYEKPAIKFEEKPVIQTVHYQQPAVVEHKVLQPAVTYQEIHKQEGYHYEKPAIKFEEKPVVQTVHYQQPAVVEHKVLQPAVTYQEIHKQEGYHYEKPAIKFEEKPVVQTVHYQQPAVVEHKVLQPAVTYQEIHKQEGYHYEKPAIKFEEKPVVQTVHYQQPAVVEHKVLQPAVTYQEIHKQEGYHYEKPAIKFEEKPVVQTVHYQQPAVVEHKVLQPAVTYQEIHKQEGYHYETPAIKFEEKPVVQTVHYQQPAVVEHKVLQPAVTYQEIHKQEGYHYEKPAIKFEDKPAVQTIHYQQPAVVQHKVVQPVTYQEVNVHKQEGYHYEKPAIISSFSIVQPVQKINHGYNYEKPAIAFEERPVQTYLPAKPVQTYIPAKPTVSYLPVAKPTQTYLPVKHEKRIEYEYPKPTVQINYQPEPVYEEPIVPKKAYVTGYQTHHKSVGYEYLKPAIKFEENVYYSTPKPTYSSTLATIIQSKPIARYEFSSFDSRFNQVAHNNPAPEVNYQQYYEEKQYLPPVQSTEAPAYLPPVTIKYLPPVTQKQYLPPVTQKQYLPPIKATIATKEYLPPVSTAQDIYVESYEAPQSRPIAQYSFSSLDAKYNNFVAQPKAIFVATTAQPEVFRINVPDNSYLPIHKPVSTYLPVTERIPIVTRKPVSLQRNYLPASTPKRVYIPITTEKYIEIPKRIRTTTEKIIVTSPSRDYLPVTRRAKKPSRDYLPATSEKPSREYLPVTKPSRDYLPVTKPSRDYLPVTKPSRDYLPVTKPSRDYLPVTKPSREYLPVKTGKQIESYSSEAYRRPAKVIVRNNKSKAIVKVNDFHPILAAKLGAQCTCFSNTLTLRKKTAQPQNYDNLDDVQPKTTRIADEEEYIGDKSDVVVEEFEYEPKRIEPTQRIIVTTEDYQSAPSPSVRRRQRPSSSTAKYVSSTESYEYDGEPVTKAIEVFLKKSRRPSSRIIEDRVSNEEVIDAVDTGLKLVKSAVKDGVREGVKEALRTKDFDRYGPGGVRSRDETLQGTVDCQRAGLFRHPTHCNKFYACRWDCSKKKFTLHVFNCPVHLTFDNNLGACNWPSQGPACIDNTLLPSD